MLQRQRKRTTFRILFHIFAMFVAGAIVAAVLAVRHFDINKLNQRVVDSFKQQTGILIEINGGMSWKFSFRPEITARDIRVRSKPWAQNPYAVVIPEMEIRLDILSMFGDNPAIQSIKLTRPVVFVEENANGDRSIPRRRPEEVVMVPMNIRERRFPIELDFGIKNFELVRPRITSITPDGQSVFAPDLLRLHLLNVTNGTLEVGGKVIADRNSYPFQIAFSEFNHEKQHFHVGIAIAGRRLHLTGDMLLNETSRPIDFVAKGRVNNVASIIKSTGIDIPRIDDGDIEISVGMQRRNIFQIRRLYVKTKDSDVLITGRVDITGEIPLLNLNVKSENFDLKTIFPNLYGPDKTPWVRPTHRPLNVFRDVPLFGELFYSVNGTVNVDAKRLGVYRDMYVEDIVATVNITGNRGEVNGGANYKGGNALLRLIAYHTGNGHMNMQFGGFARNVEVGQILYSIRINNFISRLPFNVDFYLESNGKYLTELVQNANGPVRAASTARGYAHEDLLVFLYGRDFLTVVRERITGLFTSRNASDQMPIDCAVANLLVRGGRIEMDRNVAIETPAVNMRAIGNVDFGNETLDVSIDSTPTDGIRLSFSGNLVNSIVFTGNLAEPDLRLNRDVVAGRIVTAAGMGVAAGALTGGVGLLPGAVVGLFGVDILGNWITDPNPCRTARGPGGPIAVQGDPAFMFRPADVLAREFINH